jgi:TatD DNase family protein
VIDFHCHLDLFPDPTSLIRELEESGIYVLAVTTTPKSWAHLQTLLRDSKRIRCAVGLHPELVAERAGEVDEVCALMSETRYVGEVGLDGSPNLRSSFELQQKVFTRILEQSSSLGGKILSIHSRRAATAVLDALSDKSGYGSAVLHWFSGTQKELFRAVELGCWFSVGPTMLASEKGRDLVEKMPMHRILTETDGPFAQLGGIPVKPSDVSVAEAGLAAIWKIPSKQASAQILQNLKCLIG